LKTEGQEFCVIQNPYIKVYINWKYISTHS